MMVLAVVFEENAELAGGRAGNDVWQNEDKAGDVGTALSSDVHSAPAYRSRVQS